MFDWIYKNISWTAILFSQLIFFDKKDLAIQMHFREGDTGHSFLENYLFEITIKCRSTFAIFSKSHCVKGLRIRSYLVRIFPHLD